MNLVWKHALVNVRQQVGYVSGFLLLLTPLALAQNRETQPSAAQATVRKTKAEPASGKTASNSHFTSGQFNNGFRLTVPRLRLKSQPEVAKVARPAATQPNANVGPIVYEPKPQPKPQPQQNAYSELQSVTALNGGRVRLADWMQQGEYPVLVNFWATWCGVCRKELDFLKVLTQQYAPHGLKVVTLTVEDPQESGAIVRKFVQQNQFNFPVYYSTQAACAQLNGGVPCTSIPRTFIIGRNGRVLDRLVGYSQMALANSVRSALAQPAQTRVANRAVARTR